MSWEFQNIECIVKQGKGNLVSGPFGSNISRKYFVDEGVPVIRGNNLPKDFTKFFDGGFVFITEEKAIELKNCLTITDDIIFTSAGTVGDVGLIPNKTNFEKYIISNKQIRLRVDTEKVYPLFVYYWLKQSNIKQEIVNLNTGSSIPLLTLGSVKKISISYPKSLETQKRIASILATYDDLIENNLKRIKLLEETAQNIYKEWFVNFRFPNYEHTEFDGESSLPVGWEKKTIDAFAEVITGKTPSTTNSNFYGGNIPFVKTPDMHDAPYVLSTSIYLSNEGAESQNNKFLPKNSVMVSCIGTAGVVALASTNCQTNQQINSVRFDEEFKAFYFYCFARGLKTLLEGLGSNGATMVNVNKSKFEKIELIVPDSETLKRHYGLVKVIFDQILTLQEKNEKLKEARDILLPRLMNRTIEV
jgi:type I restriction enzyme S subunit